jgi:peptidoglycan/LPS O-acetylase OafA/YrhL
MQQSANESDYTRISQAFVTIRGICIIGIVVYHAWGFTRGYASMSDILAQFADAGLKGKLESIFDTISLLGLHGVSAFLVASGFGLTASCISKQQEDGNFRLTPFLKRRLTRIVPMFWLAIACAILGWLINPASAPYGGGIWQGSWSQTLWSIFATATTIRNFFPDIFRGINGAWWYVGLSVQLYLIFPFLLRLARRIGWEYFMVTSVLASLFYRLIILLSPIDPELKSMAMLGAFFPSRLFEFSLGMLLAIALLKPDTLNSKLTLLPRFLLRRRYLPIHIALALLGVLLHHLIKGGEAFAEIPLSLGLMGLLVQCIVLMKALPGFGTVLLTPLNIVGDYSYGIYLTHMNIYAGFWGVMGAILAIIPIPQIYWIRLLMVVLWCCVVGIAFEGFYRNVSRRLG